MHVLMRGNIQPGGFAVTPHQTPYRLRDNTPRRSLMNSAGVSGCIAARTLSQARISFSEAAEISNDAKLQPKAW